MKITKVAHETNKWLNSEQTTFEKIVEVLLFLSVAYILCDVILK